ILKSCVILPAFVTLNVTVPAGSAENLESLMPSSLGLPSVTAIVVTLADLCVWACPEAGLVTTPRDKQSRPMVAPARPSPVTLKVAEDSPAPAPLATTIFPALAFLGTVAVIWVVESRVNFALVLPNATVVTPTKLVPVIVTLVPGLPDAGLKWINEGTEA